MNKADKYNQMAKRGAFQIVKALKLFEGEPDAVRQQGEQLMMHRAQVMRNGNNVVIEGDDLIKEVPENPEPAAETA